MLCVPDWLPLVATVVLKLCVPDPVLVVAKEKVRVPDPPLLVLTEDPPADVDTRNVFVVRLEDRT
jgi:hypothetical protein